MVICRNCGARNVDTNIYCSNCGDRLRKAKNSGSYDNVKVDYINVFISLVLGVIIGWISYTVLDSMFVGYIWYESILPLIVAGFVSMTSIKDENFSFLISIFGSLASVYLISAIPALIILIFMLNGNFSLIFDKIIGFLGLSFVGLIGGVLSLPLRYIKTILD